MYCRNSVYAMLCDAEGEIISCSGKSALVHRPDRRSLVGLSSVQEER